MTATEDDVTRALTGQDPAAYRTLDEHLAGEEPDFDAGPVEVADELHADQWLRRLRAIEWDRQRVVAIADAQQTRIQEWLDAQQMPLPTGLIAELPQGVWQDRQGNFYSVDKRVGTWAVRNGAMYYRSDDCPNCGADALREWMVDADGGVEVVHCTADCDLFDHLPKVDER